VGPGADERDGKGPRYLALRPLYLEPQSRSAVAVPEVGPDGHLQGTRQISFRDQDVEPWARLLLADADLFTSAPYAAVLEEHGPEVLELLSEAKGRLAGSIAEGLAFVFAADDGDGEAADGREAAMRALREGAVAGLAAAYEVGTIVQDDGDQPSPGKAPVPLRPPPSPPSVSGQTAAATREEDHPELEDLTEWTFGVAYSHEHAEQDEVLLTLTCNPADDLRSDPSSPPDRSPSGPDLAEELAAYASLAPVLKEIIGLPAERLLTQTDKRAKILAALGSAATLIGAVAEAWARHWSDEEPVPPPPPYEARLGESRRFRIAAQRRDGGDALEALTLTLEDGEGPSPGGRPPAVEVLGRAGELTRLEVKEVEPGRRWRYEPEEGAEPIRDGLALRLEWTALDVVATQRARASLSARRNENLEPGVATNPVFVMSTATVSAGSAAMPLLRWSGEWRLDGELEQALAEGLETLFEEGPELLVAVRLSYGYQPAKPEDSSADVTSVIPVALLPELPPAPATIAKAVAEAAARWEKGARPAGKEGAWLVALTLSRPAASGARPLFVLDHLAIPLKDGA
jgi:hypothetical protein